jgi:hypothetical protein
VSAKQPTRGRLANNAELFGTAGARLPAVGSVCARSGFARTCEHIVRISNAGPEPSLVHDDRLRVRIANRTLGQALKTFMPAHSANGILFAAALL